MEYNIKILKDTPFDKKDTVLSIEAFRLKYNYLINTHNSDVFLVSYLNGGYLKYNLDTDLSEWFEVIEIRDSFKAGDWVWHEGEKKAYTIVIDSNQTKEFRPNYCTLAAVNACPGIYKRLATTDEICYYNLFSYCDGQILIGEHKCYYFNNVWKELITIHKNITKYIQYQKEFYTVSTLKQFSSEIEATWSCVPNGLKVGCMEIPHNEVIEIAKKLKLI